MLELTNEVNKMELDNLRVDQIILDKELDDYDKMVIVVWDEIVILRSNFIIIEKNNKRFKTKWKKHKMKHLIDFGVSYANIIIILVA